jgi:predicted metal-binding protein
LDDLAPGGPFDRPALALPTVYVCVTCRSAVDPEAAERPGARLCRALQARAGDGFRVEPVECLSVCKRPCTVAVGAPGRWTYIYGDLDPDGSVETIVEGVTRYATAEAGLVPWRERPEAFRKGVIARLPPRAFTGETP